MEVRLTDNGVPPLQSTMLGKITIYVNRNSFSPVFAGNYNVRIQETTPVSSQVVVVAATDDDGNVCI